MSMRYLGGFISASYNPLKVPNAPTIGTATAGDTQATITFTAPSNVGGGAITGYIAVATKTSDGTAVSTTGSASPITITGLTNGSAYTIKVAAVNAYGPGPYSAPSGSVTPAAPNNKLYAWGSNGNFQLGINLLNDSYSSPVQIGALTTWSTMTLGGQTGGATKLDGTLWAWGDNQYGQLGQNNRVNQSSPVQIGALTNWASVSAGDQHMLATKTDGTLWSWGDNSAGQLGQNDQVNRSSPVQIGALTNWSKVFSSPTSNAKAVIAVKTDGTLWAWGNDIYGQLGQNNATYRSSPVQIGSGTTWANACISFQTIAITTNGAIWSWGYNNQGQLGQNNTISRSSPVQIGALTTWSKVNTGSYYNLAAVKTDGTIWVWGGNSNGQLGQNNRIALSSPVQVGALTTWSTVTLGSEFTAATKTDGTLWAWGQNTNGQLGQNNTTYRSSPVQVGAQTYWNRAVCNSNGIIAISS